MRPPVKLQPPPLQLVDLCLNLPTKVAICIIQRHLQHLRNEETSTKGLAF